MASLREMSPQEILAEDPKEISKKVKEEGLKGDDIRRIACITLLHGPVKRNIEAYIKSLKEKKFPGSLFADADKKPDLDRNYYKLVKRVPDDKYLDEVEQGAKSLLYRYLGNEKNQNRDPHILALVLIVFADQSKKKWLTKEFVAYSGDCAPGSLRNYARDIAPLISEPHEAAKKAGLKETLAPQLTKPPERYLKQFGEFTLTAKQINKAYPGLNIGQDIVFGILPDEDLAEVGVAPEDALIVAIANKRKVEGYAQVGCSAGNALVLKKIYVESLQKNPSLDAGLLVAFFCFGLYAKTAIVQVLLEKSTAQRLLDLIELKESNTRSYIARGKRIGLSTIVSHLYARGLRRC